MNKKNIHLPAEWHPQSAVQLTWLHAETDWREILDEVTPCFVEIAKAICVLQKLVIVCPNSAAIIPLFDNESLRNITFSEMPTNDTWARDHGAISVFEGEVPYLYDFTFNGWGMKFAANLDNQINRKLFESNVFHKEVQYRNYKHFILEGGSIESDGKGTILTSSECLLSENRNNKTRKEVEDFLIETFGLKRILWIENGYLEGDDTDSHIDTLARFCNETTIAYIKCDDQSDVHFAELAKMEAQLKSFRTLSGEPYTLIALPMADEVMCDGERLPATYANFLIINGAVLLPTYQTPKDEIAKRQLKIAFPDRQIIGINCLPLIKQHGSLHCVTMQFPAGFVN
jgi:agmatine/peptidylarginine deiminase